ncbi:MAG: hypothetical protein MZV64_65365 [Ignavibacteriales bacterium]|nr:hypothetical protein [Ignavibacteriales bacterium]
MDLEQRRLHIELEFESLFGTDRTITLIGILGFILYIVMPENLALFFAGGFVLSAFLGIYYFNKIKIKKSMGLYLVNYSVNYLLLNAARLFAAPVDGDADCCNNLNRCGDERKFIPVFQKI